MSSLKRVPSGVDTLSIYNTDAQNLGAVSDSTTNFVVIGLFSRNITTGTYKNGDSIPVFGIVANLKKKIYFTNETDKNTLTISSLSSTAVSGSYSAKVYGLDSSYTNITGNFSTTF